MLLYYYFRKSFDTLSWLYDLFREHSFTKSYGCTICSGNIPSQRAMVVRFVPGTFLQKELWHARMVVRFVPGTFLHKVVRFVPGTFLHKELWLYILFREHSFRKSFGTLSWLYDCINILLLYCIILLCYIMFLLFFKYYYIIVFVFVNIIIIYLLLYFVISVSFEARARS